MIRDKYNFPPEKQRLLFRGEELEPDQGTLDVFGVNEVCSVHFFPLKARE